MQALSLQRQLLTRAALPRRVGQVLPGQAGGGPGGWRAEAAGGGRLRGGPPLGAGVLLPVRPCDPARTRAPPRLPPPAAALHRQGRSHRTSDGRPPAQELQLRVLRHTGLHAESCFIIFRDSNIATSARLSAWGRLRQPSAGVWQLRCGCLKTDPPFVPESKLGRVPSSKVCADDNTRRPPGVDWHPGKGSFQNRWSGSFLWADSCHSRCFLRPQARHLASVHQSFRRPRLPPKSSPLGLSLYCRLLSKW